VRDAPEALAVTLDDDAAVDTDRAGGKAAALAVARRHGVRTLSGVVLTTDLSEQVDGGATLEDIDDVERAFALAGGDDQPLVVRSSSVVEDQGESSAAGQFESVVGVEGIEDFREAIMTVLDSRVRADAADRPIAVLVQPAIDPEVAGVYFEVDPVTGRTDRRVITVVEGQPDQLVSGEVQGSRYVLDTTGEVLEEEIRDGVTLSASHRRELVGAGEQLADVFDGPQDVEWAVVDGELVILQSRPVTTEIRGVPQGALFGPGPVAETFPEPLSRLEEEMWVPPLREAVREALVLSGAHRREDLEGRELVVAIDGRVAIDLEAAGEAQRDPSLADRLSPAKRVRRLRSAWRIGRLRAALPHLVGQLADRVDADLDLLPGLDELSSRQLVALIDRTRGALQSLHAHEILMGLLADSQGGSFTGASVALRVLAESRRDGFTDAEIIARSPVVLALAPPRVAPSPRLPESTADPDVADVPGLPDTQVRRETLRLRVRWLQELSAQAAWKLGERLAQAGLLSDPALVRHLCLSDLDALVRRRAVIVGDRLGELSDAVEREAEEVAPLPSRFRVSDLGRPIGEGGAGAPEGGTGAGGGQADGIVSHDDDDPPDGAVLVVGSLRPDLGPQLGRLTAIVAETGSVLSHLAILAREQSVPTVVGHRDARQELPEGARVRVDGDLGTVTLLDDDGDDTGQHDDDRLPGDRQRDGESETDEEHR